MCLIELCTAPERKEIKELWRGMECTLWRGEIIDMK